MTADYPMLARTIASLTEGESDTVALMAAVVCEPYHADDRLDWTGFYRITKPGLPEIGPEQGGHGRLTIPFDRGVCGAAAPSRQVRIVPVVDAFPGHVACATSTRSETVLAARDAAGEIIAVPDIDGDRPDAFTEADAEALTAILDATFALRQAAGTGARPSQTTPLPRRRCGLTSRGSWTTPTPRPTRPCK